jgi:elongation factor Ts
MKITAADVNKLRQATGAGMMDCKKALQEAEGDFDQAVINLRKKGQKVSEKRADREAKEGVVMARISDDKSLGIMLALNCETDFVAKNEDFINFANTLADKAMEAQPSNVEELKGLNIDGHSISEMLIDYTGKIGEKIDVSRYSRLEGNSVVPYIHSNNKLGVLVSLNKDSNDSIASAGRDVAMQIASMRPIAVDRDGVDPSIVEREIEIGKEKALKEGKPAQIIEKIAQGMLNKFFRENTLLDQSFVKDNSLTVSKMLDGVEKGLTVNNFERIEIGA